MSSCERTKIKLKRKRDLGKKTAKGTRISYLAKIFTRCVQVVRTTDISTLVMLNYDPLVTKKTKTCPSKVL